MSLTWEADRAKVDGELADDLDATLGPDPAEWVVYRGWASMDGQAILYKAYKEGKGPLAAPPGRSAHNWGFATDIARRVNGKLLWDYEDESWARMQHLIDAHPRLHGGWKFPPAAPADPDHIQSTKWPAFRAELQQEGKW